MNRLNFLKGLTCSLLTPFLIRPTQGGLPKPAMASEKTSSSVDLSRLLRCIAEVETGNRDDLVGKKGERSRYQISAAVWKDLWYGSCHETCRGDTARMVAMRHLTDLQRKYSIYKASEAWLLAYAWNRGQLNYRFDDYGMRIQNLYDDPSFKTL